jgi:hypothetical protein
MQLLHTFLFTALSTLNIFLLENFNLLLNSAEFIKSPPQNSVSFSALQDYLQASRSSGF